MINTLITALLISISSGAVLPRQLVRTDPSSDAAPVSGDYATSTRVSSTPANATLPFNSTLLLPTGPKTNLTQTGGPTRTRPAPATSTHSSQHSIPANPRPAATAPASKPLSADQTQCDVREGVTCRLDGERRTILTAADLVRSAARADYQADPIEDCSNPYPVDVEAKFFKNRLTYTLDDAMETDIDIHLAGWTMTTLQREGGSFETDISLRISLCHIKPTSTILDSCACA